MEQSKQTILLNKYCEKSDTAGLHSDLIKNEDADISLDFNDVTAVSTPLLQLIISAAVQWKSNGKSFCLINTNEDVRGDFDLIGLSKLNLFSEVN